MTPSFTSSQAANILQVSVSTVQNLANKGILKHWKIPPDLKHRRFNREDLIELMEKQGMDKTRISLYD